MLQLLSYPEGENPKGQAEQLAELVIEPMALANELDSITQSFGPVDLNSKFPCGDCDFPYEEFQKGLRCQVCTVKENKKLQKEFQTKC